MSSDKESAGTIVGPTEDAPSAASQERRLPVQVAPDGASLLAPALFTNSVFVTMDDLGATVFFMQTPTLLGHLPGLNEAAAAANAAIESNAAGAKLTLYAPAVAKIHMSAAQLENLQKRIGEVIEKHRVNRGGFTHHEESSGGG